MWNYERLHAWFAQDVEKKDMIFRQFLPAAHVNKHRSTVRHQIGNYLIWLLASAYEAKTGLKQDDGDLSDLVRHLHRIDDKTSIESEVAQIKKYMDATPSPFDMRAAKQLSGMEHAEIFLKAVKLKKASLLSAPVAWWRYSSAKKQVADLIHAELLTFVGGFKLGKFVRDTPSVVMRLKDTPLSPE